MKLRVLITDDHPLMLQGIKYCFNKISEVEVVAEANSGQVALDLIKVHNPDLVTLDIDMPGLDGFETLKLIRENYPEIRVMMLSSFFEVEYVAKALRLGAVGYVSKKMKIPEYQLAVTEIMNGNTYLSPEISNQDVQAFLKNESEQEALTEQQQKILNLLGAGHNIKFIADQMEISEKTVYFHRAELMKRLNIQNNMDLCRYALRRN